MKCRTAKEFLRPKAIEHYIKKKRSDLFVFMSLYNDKEPYPIEDLAEVQKSRVGVLKAEFDRLPTEFLANELNFAEKMLKQIEQRANALGKGLFLLVKKTGAKVWRFRYKKPFAKTETDMSIGSFPDVSLAQARAMREDYRALLAQDIDPQEYRQQKQDEEQARRENTFLHLAEQWKAKMLMDVKKGAVKDETLAKNWTIITKYLIPDLGQMPIESITPKRVIQAIQPLDARGRAETRDRAIALLNRVMKFAVNCNALEFNKCVSVKDHYSRPKAEHYKTIRPEELCARSG